MAVEIGTATDHVDLYNKLYTFLTSNADLVAANQQWERVTTVGNAPPFVANDPSSDDGVTGAVMLKGPGLAQQDEIFVSLYLYDNTDLDVQMVYLMGHKGVLAGNSTYRDHVGSSNRKGFLCWSQPMEYWFVASGRRFMGVVKCGTVYESFYCGFYLPYTTPQSNPYPLMIGGTTGYTTGDVNLSDVRARHRAFPDPGDAGSSNSWAYSTNSSLAMLTPGGDWVYPSNAGNNQSGPEGGGAYSRDAITTYPYNAPVEPRGLDVGTGMNPPGSSSGTWDILLDTYLSSETQLLGGGYLLTPVSVVSSAYENPGVTPVGFWGIMDGVFHVAGVGNAAENIVQQGGVDHLVVQNVYRTANYSFFAMALA